MKKFPTVTILGLAKEMIFILGGMGAGITLARLAGAWARRGGVGTVSSVALDAMVGRRLGRKVSHREAARIEIQDAKKISGHNGAIAINCMALIDQLYIPSIEGAIEGGVDIIVVGAGLPMTLPEIVGNAPVAIVPIVSSARALEIICRRWERSGRVPDAVVLEGPLAGGHLGFKADDIPKPEFKLENLFKPVKEVALRYGNFPVIVAGGIYTHEDIIWWGNFGADGVQFGTRAAATYESGASPDFKKAIVKARAEDIEIATPGSPAGLPFRVINFSPGYQQTIDRTRPLLCDKFYLLHKGKDGRMTCPAKDGYDALCLCNGLLGAVDNVVAPPIWTVGINAARIDRILYVDELIDEFIWGKFHYLYWFFRFWRPIYRFVRRVFHWLGIQKSRRT